MYQSLWTAWFQWFCRWIDPEFEGDENVRGDVGAGTSRVEEVEMEEVEVVMDDNRETTAT